MTKEEVLEALCLHDKRSPNSLDNDELLGPLDQCLCDNCLYGRTKLAEELLKYK